MTEIDRQIVGAFLLFFKLVGIIIGVSAAAILILLVISVVLKYKR